MQNVLCRFILGGCMQEQEGYLPEFTWTVCGGHRPSCLAPQEQTGSW